jgi:hypothetical protein
MFDLKKQITKVSAPIIPTMDYKNGQLYTRQSKSDGKGGFTKINLPITEPFAMDIWKLQSGWYWWTGTGTDRRRHTMLVPLGENDPEQPNEDAVACYSVPVFSTQLGIGGADFVVENAGAFIGLQALLDDIKGCPEVRENKVPIIAYVGSVDTDDGPVPGLAITNWTPRPDRWGNPLISL